MKRRVTRRRFLFASAAAAGLAAAGARPGAQQPSAAAPAGPLPPPVSALIHRGRQERAREILRAAKMSALMEVPGPGLFYLTGLPLDRSDSISAFVLPAEGAPVLLCPPADRALVEGAESLAAESIEIYDLVDDPFEILLKRLKKLDVSHLAIAPAVRYEEFAPIHSRLPKVTFSSNDPMVGEPRQVKIPEEMQLIEAGALLAQEAVEAGLKEAREGMTEDELAARIAGTVQSRGAFAECLVTSGPRSASPRPRPGIRRLGPGDPVIASCGVRIHGYWARVARTAVIGRATGRMKLIHQTLREALDLGLEKATTEVVAGNVDQIMRATLGGRGFLKLILHGSGSGLGLERWERPFISPDYLVRLVAGNVATLGQAVYTAGDYGIRIEDVVAITTSRARMITRPPDSLIEV